MKAAGVRELRANFTEYLDRKEPVLVTRHGKISGLYLPLSEPSGVPDDLRRELAAVLGKHLDGLMAERGLKEKDIQGDFDAHRRRRRGH